MSGDPHSASPSDSSESPSTGNPLLPNGSNIHSDSGSNSVIQISIYDPTRAVLDGCANVAQSEPNVDMEEDEKDLTCTDADELKDSDESKDMETDLSATPLSPRQKRQRSPALTRAGESRRVQATPGGMSLSGEDMLCSDEIMSPESDSDALKKQCVRSLMPGSVSSLSTGGGQVVISSASRRRVLLCPLENILTMDNDLMIGNIMLQREGPYQGDPTYPSRLSEIAPHMRSVLIDWMIEICQEYLLGRETLYYAINYVDRYLSYNPELSRANFQLLGATAMFIASKVEEPVPPVKREICFASGHLYTANDIGIMERSLLTTLRWELRPQTPFSFLTYFIKHAARSLHESEADEDLVHEVLSVDRLVRATQLVDGALHFVKSMEYFSSHLASAAFCLIYDDILDADFIARITPYTNSVLEESGVMELLRPFLPIEQAQLVPYEESKWEQLRIPPEDAYTRQTHSGRILEVARSHPFYTPS